MLVNKLTLLITDANYFPTDTEIDVLQDPLLREEDRKFAVAMQHKSVEIMDRLKAERAWLVWATFKERQGQMNPWDRICVDVQYVMNSVHELFERRGQGSHGR